MEINPLDGALKMAKFKMKMSTHYTRNEKCNKMMLFGFLSISFSSLSDNPFIEVFSVHYKFSDIL